MAKKHPKAAPSPNLLKKKKKKKKKNGTALTPPTRCPLSVSEHGRSELFGLRLTRQLLRFVLGLFQLLLAGKKTVFFCLKKKKKQFFCGNQVKENNSSGLVVWWFASFWFWALGFGSWVGAVFCFSWWTEVSFASPPVAARALVAGFWGVSVGFRDLGLLYVESLRFCFEAARLWVKGALGLEVGDGGGGCLLVWGVKFRWSLEFVFDVLGPCFAGCELWVGVWGFSWYVKPLVLVVVLGSCPGWFWVMLLGWVLSGKLLRQVRVLSGSERMIFGVFGVIFKRHGFISLLGAFACTRRFGSHPNREAKPP